MNKILVAGGGGFIGGYLVKRLIENGSQVRCVDIKKKSDWYQISNNAENIELNLETKENCEKAVLGCKQVFNLACNMGGMGFIENNKALCMLSVLVNTHLLMASKKAQIEKYFFSSSACAYNTNLQNKPSIEGLKETDAYPAMPEDGYGWEKLFSERMCRHFTEDYKIDTKVARFHNVYGPHGTYDGGREKAPAAICRKIATAKKNKYKNIEVWGDGQQTRSFLYIEDCVDAVLRLFESNVNEPINIGSEEQVSINQMIDIVEEIADYKVKRNYQLDKPKGVRGRSSNNQLIEKKLQWKPTYSLKEGLRLTYEWIEKQI
jgi:GDP-D-mannose 3',5'-epimerase